MTENPKDTITLKWGTLKSWDLESDEARKLMKEYVDIGVTYSAMAQKDTPRQKEIICNLLDICDGDIWNDWEAKMMSKEEAKKYVMEYRMREEDSDDLPPMP